MNVVDSSAWLEYFAGSDAAEHFAPAIEDIRKLVVPSITLLEVFKRIAQQAGEREALRAVALMQQGQVVPLDATGALSAARVGVQYKLPMADAVIYATTLRHQATLWTQDEHFDGLQRVRFFRKGAS